MTQVQAKHPAPINAKEGDRGAHIAQIQTLLNQQGARLPVTGYFGSQTKAAVISYQKKNRLVVDGIVGEKTLSSLQTPSKPINALYLSDKDIIQAAKDLGVDQASIRAVNEVESAGTGLHPDGRPKILFERHIMRRRLISHKIDPAPHQKRSPNLVNTIRGGYTGGAGEWVRLNNAKAIHEAAAIESCSWGLFQIMGFHWQALGYESAQNFAKQMHTGEGAHLNAFVRFIKNDPTLHKALKAKNWKSFARLYNGAAYATNLYDIKLDRAYKKYSTQASKKAP